MELNQHEQKLYYVILKAFMFGFMFATAIFGTIIALILWKK